MLPAPAGGIGEDHARRCRAAPGSIIAVQGPKVSGVIILIANAVPSTSPALSPANSQAKRPSTTVARPVPKKADHLHGKKVTEGAVGKNAQHQLCFQELGSARPVAFGFGHVEGQLKGFAA